LPLVGTHINVEAKRQPCLTSPDVAIKLRDREDIEAVKPDAPVGPLTDVVGQDAFTVSVGWWLCELARTRDVTASHVKPVPLHPPLRNLCHACTPFFTGKYCNAMPPASHGAALCWESRDGTDCLPHGSSDGKLRRNEADHKTSPPLNLRAKSRTLGVSGCRKLEQRVGCRQSAARLCSARV
jgi:hypothetical protein